MSWSFSEEQLIQLNAFIELCKDQPLVLHHPKLTFFKDYLVSLGVTLPTATFGTKPASGDGHTASKVEEDTPKPTSSESDESEPESEIDIDMEGVIKDDSSDATYEMGDPSKETTDEERDQSDEKRSSAMRAFSEQNYEEAITLYSEAIKLNPQSALLFAKRGQVFLKQNKLHACIKDCSYALELNCDSAAAYKVRGRAYRLLGMFEEASHDLCESLKIDYDDQANEWLNEVKPNAEKLRQHKLSVQRKKEDKEHREKLRRARKAQEARAKAAKEQAQASKGEPTNDEDIPLQIDTEYLIKMMTDPEITAVLMDPEVKQAFFDVSGNPANLVKYQNNPKVTAAFELFKKKFGTQGHMWGKGSGGAGGPGSDPGAGAPGTGTGPGTGPKPYDDDVGLD